MWQRNSDTGKWSLQIDQLPKDYYDGLKQDLEKVKLYSKCLSGSVYISIDNFDNIYNTLQIDELGYYIDDFYAIRNLPSRGPIKQLNLGNYNQFYKKYLKENAFTIKNLFTPTKLIDTEVENISVVDVSTTEKIIGLTSSKPNLVIDGVRLIEGHRVLIKDQMSEITLPSTTNVEKYFTEVLKVSDYFFVETNVTDVTYEFFNQENGVYVYTNNQLVRQNDLNNYDKSYKLKVIVKYGNVNSDKEFHLKRLKNNYYPVEGENISFSESQNWILRHQLDYNNILDLNHFDLIKTEPSQVYSKIEDFTYSIPSRLIAIGEFGVIINNQDELTPNATFSNSTIIDTKYKLNFRSITETNDWYWICGDEGTLLKVYKPDFSIERIELNIFTQLTSVSFFDNLNGFVVGKFNTIFHTTDGGIRWTKLDYSDYESFSYTKVLFKDFNNVFIIGSNGLFLELTRDGNTWISYKRQISKLVDGDRYLLVDDINDMIPLKWVTVEDFVYIDGDDSSDFADSLKFQLTIDKGRFDSLIVQITSPFEGNNIYRDSQFYIDLKIIGSQSGVVYEDFPNTELEFNPLEYTFYKGLLRSDLKTTQSIGLPLDIDGNLKNDKFSLIADVYYNFDGLSNSINQSFYLKTITFDFETISCDVILLGCDNTVIVYDKENKLFDYGNDFIYIDFDKKIQDIRTLTKAKVSEDDKIYIGSDKIYYFKFGDIKNFTKIDENVVTAKLIDGPDFYVNKLFAYDRLYLAGNESLLRYIDFEDVGTNNITNLWDPTFIGKYKSKLIFLDYDIASKLNFFTDLGQYRMPNSVSIPKLGLTNSDGFIEFESLVGQTSWVDYYKDSEKTFEYYTNISDETKVEFSTRFVYSGVDSDFSINNNQISINLSDILKLAPSLSSLSSSEFLEGPTPILQNTSELVTQPTTISEFDVLIYKNIIIIKRPYEDQTKIGDTIRIISDVIDCNLIVNKIIYYYKLSGDVFQKVENPPPSLNSNSVFEKYIYCFSNFNQNIINNLKITQNPIHFKNLNIYKNVEDLIDKVNLNPLSIGYSVIESNEHLTITPRFNNKTAYYNLAINVKTSNDDFVMNYNESFLIFGFSPNYNIYDLLNRIDSTIFTSTKKFSILPEYIGLPSAIGEDYTFEKIKILVEDSSKIIMGEKFKFHWESLLIWTFVDVICFNMDGDSETNEKLLIIEKYFDESENGYVVQFHKKLLYPDFTNGIDRIDILSRNTLSQISSDLQMLNNIQRTTSEKTINSTFSFTQYENEVKFKFPTDSYLKVFVSDFDIQQKVTSIIYTDHNYQLAMNILNVEKQLQYNFDSIIQSTQSVHENKLKYSLTSILQGEFEVGDLIKVELTGGSQSSRFLNPQYQGLQTVLEIQGQFIITSVDYGVPVNSLDTGKITFIKRDKFLNYLPIDLYSVGGDRKPKNGIEVLPEMVVLNGTIFSLKNVNTNKFKIKFVDGLFLQDIDQNFSWFLEAETSNATIGKNDKGLVWYSGVWRCGRWFGGTWISGEWISGDWYGGEWYSLPTKNNILSVQIIQDTSNDKLSKWQGGRWFGGDWYGGTWYDGRRYGGNWYNGLWFNGIWNDGDWYNGRFQGGIWVSGNWFNGLFNCDSKLSYWIDGVFSGGDFENGTWYNGQFGNQNGSIARFGTKSINTRVSIWHGGKWINGDFHSVLNIDSITLQPTVSDVHSLSIWKTGLWLGGNFYGGIAYNIDFRGGIWHGGILDEIQISGVDKIYPEDTSRNVIYLNGIFKFNVGDIIYILDDYRGGPFSSIGSNDNIRDYRINKIEEDTINQTTTVYLNFNLSRLVPPVDVETGTQSWTNIETNLRVVSHFTECVWKSGLWSNGYFEKGNFESGVWYNGVFEGIWGK